ncbi:MAG: TVP38/TMEM64 family protein [Lachnospiraceae bacterium]|nr:TVP38/TMEM64 family protein [Lachnospiraceae bacterium]
MIDNSNKNCNNSKARRIVRVALVIFALLFCCFLGYLIVRFVSDKEFFQKWVKERGIWGRLLYGLMVIFQVVVALVPGEPLEIAGGYAFGAVHGTIIYLISATIGGMLVFLFVRKYGQPFVEMFFSGKDINKFKFLRYSSRLTKGQKEGLLVFLFVLPGTPKDLICYIAGLTTISSRLWLLVCSLGRLPSLITSTIGGQALESKDYTNAVVAFVIAFAISLIGVFVYKAVRGKHSDKDKHISN